ncbi:hypothetical protein UPYG_G00246490 [Umbra pygmaea]|uniref:CST complex subunit CTC1 n=1 Tax=Umbra pygmaea TaxID=75934 RepID=A0ABD0X476_UMBPY
METFLANFHQRSEVEREWLQQLFVFVKDNLCPVVSGFPPEQLALALVLRLERALGSSCIRSFPLSYRLVSVSELATRQRTPSCSNLTWSTNQHIDWAREAEQAHPSHKALPRCNLLLIGCLSNGRGLGGACDGSWMVRDASGSLHAELLSPSPLWLGLPLLFPFWNYIPQHALGQDQDNQGYLELIGCPLPLTSDSEMTFNPADVNVSKAVGVKEAMRLMEHRVKGLRVCVYGEVCGVGPLLDITGNAFFYLRLRERQNTLPVLVMEPGCLWWRRCVYVGGHVCVSALRLCVLRGWSSNRVLCVTTGSCLSLLPHTLTPDLSDAQGNTPNTHTPDAVTHSSAEETQFFDRSSVGSAFLGGQMDDRQVEDRQVDETDEPMDETCCIIPSPHSTKHSRVISYQGVLTCVLSAEAGLYVIDGKVGLCLAYQPIQRRGLRPGAEIELHDVHFLYRASPHCLPSMLCMCLRSSLRITSFSRLGSEVSGHSDISSDALLPRLLLEMNLGISQYLWLCHCCTALSDRLVPHWVRAERAAVVAGRLLEWVLTWETPGVGGGRRDIYREMLQEPHHCPLTEYQVCSPGCEYVSVSECVSAMQAECWSSLSLTSLLPGSGSSLTQAELNPLLAWSVGLSLGQDRRPRPLLLVGVLELPRTHTAPSGAHTLLLRDQTGTLTCVNVETSGDDSGGQRAVSSTAWIGCLVAVRCFTMVMERFLQSKFPTYEHLDQERYITHKHCSICQIPQKVYIQLCLNDLHILSPSASMATALREKNRVGGEERREGGEERREGGEERREGGEERMEEEDEEGEGGAKRARYEDRENKPCISIETPGGGESSLPGGKPCISVAMRVMWKEGVAWRNEGHDSEAGEAGLSLCFSVKAETIGLVQCWGRDPKNSPLQEREIDRDGQTTPVDLLFVRSSVRWFPLIHAGSFYRLTAPNTQDPSVLTGCLVAVKSGVELHASPSLMVRSDWRIHTVTRPLRISPDSQVITQKVMSVAEVLDCRCDVELVSFYGLISQRITLQDQRGPAPTTQYTDVESGLSVRLTVCLETRGRSLHVYLDLSHTPYPPGIIPGNTVLFTGFQRRLSRVGAVYCRSLPVSCLTVTAVGKTTAQSCEPTPPIVLLGVWGMAGAEQCVFGRVRAHVVCVLYLQLQWICSLCGSIYTQRCTRSHPLCDSASSVFQAVAKTVVEDGSGEAHIWFSCPLVSCLLGLTTPQWEGLQRSLRARGHLRVYTRGRSLVSDLTCDDPLLQYLSCVCNSSAVCRPLTLSCTLHTRSHTPAAHREDSAQLKRLTRGDREFVTKMPPPLQLTCTHILEEETY